MKTDQPPRATIEQPAVSHAVDGWIPLVDEPPPLDWELEVLFTPTGSGREDGGQEGALRWQEEDAAAAVGAGGSGAIATVTTPVGVHAGARCNPP